MLNIINMVRKIRTLNNLVVKRPIKNINIYADEHNILLLQKIENYILSECNIIDCSWSKFEATTYKYVYKLNQKVIGKVFRDKKLLF